MRKFGKYKGKLVRFSLGVDKLSILDTLLHLFGIHLVRTNDKGITYCRLCNKSVDK